MEVKEIHNRKLQVRTGTGVKRAGVQYFVHLPSDCKLDKNVVMARLEDEGREVYIITDDYGELMKLLERFKG